MTYDPRGYWEATLADSFDVVGVGYPYLPKAFNSELYRAMRRAAARAVRDARIAPSSVLDVGSGSGFWIDFWRSRGVEHVTAVDLTETAVDGLRSRFPGIAVVQGDLTAGIDVAGPFDAISVMSVLLHIVDDALFQQALLNLAELLTENGSAVVIDPVVVHTSWGPQPDATANSKARSLDDWRAATEHAGLELVSMRPVTWLLAEPVDTRSRASFWLLERMWALVSRAVYGSEFRGRLAGRSLRVVDGLLLHLPGTGASTKCFVLRKRWTGKSRH